MKLKISPNPLALSLYHGERIESLEAVLLHVKARLVATPQCHFCPCKTLGFKTHKQPTILHWPERCLQCCLEKNIPSYLLTRSWNKATTAKPPRVYIHPSIDLTESSMVGSVLRSTVILKTTQRTRIASTWWTGSLLRTMNTNGYNRENVFLND